MEQILDQSSPTGSADNASPGGGATASTSSRSQTLRHAAILIGRRLLFDAAVLLAIIYLTHLALNAAAAPGEPFLPLVPHSFQQTLAYLGRLIRGDLGLSRPGSVAFSRLPVAEILPRVVSHSFGLLGATFLISIAMGVPVGVWAALRRHTKKALPVLVVSFIGISTPSFFAALFLQIAAIQYTRTFGRSLLPVGGFGWDSHLILPMLVLAARPVAQITRVTFVSVADVLDRDFVRVAHSKGLRSYQVLLVHTLRNAAVPILTTVMVSLGFALSSLPVVEFYFGWNGIGDTLLSAIFQQDINLSVALLLSLGLLFVFINLVLEISYVFIDPRLREKPTYAGRGERVSPISMLVGAVAELRRFLVDNPVSQWLRRGLSPKEEEASPFRAVLERSRSSQPDDAPAGDQVRWGAWRRGVLGNPPLLLGLAIISVLFYLVLFGPQLAPYSPNTTQPIAQVGGVLTTPPFPPSALHPWGTDPLGRDLLSLVLAGAQQTLILAFGVMVARMIIGFVLGVLAGWFRNSWLDRFIMGTVQAMAVFPTLLLAALLIFAIGIQKGMPTFLIALGLVGWGEITQLVRGEVISIRARPFIESAVAVGQRTARLILIHVLPNLAPILISVAALEVGAVLLILGELGFLGIFISGGVGSDFGLYAQVPEWGSLLSNVRNYARAFPWTAFYPMAAFFIAILGFNLLSEGLRRLIEEVGLVIDRLLNRYTLAFAALVVAGFFWSQNNTGEIVFLRQQANQFDEEAALSHVEALTDPALQGRALDSDGLMDAAEYIRDQFRQLGLQPAGESMTYLQTGRRTYQDLVAEPGLVVGDGGDAELEYREDYAVYPSPTQNMGQAEGRVRLLHLGPKASLAGSDLSQDIVLLLEAGQLARLQDQTCRGVLIVARDSAELKRRHTLSAQPPSAGCGRDTPVLLIRDRLANRLLSDTDHSMFSLETEVEELGQGQLIDVPTSVSVTIDIPGVVREEVPAVNVIGQLPGTSAELDSNLIIVAAQYDTPPLGPEGGAPAGANDNASAVAVMLEVIRTMHESGYQPLKTFLFVAYSGEGLPDGAPAPVVERFVQGRSTFANAFDLEGVVYLRGLGSSGGTLNVWTQEASRLAKLMETAAHLNDVETERVNGPPTMKIFAPGVETAESNTEVPRVGISVQGWQTNARLTTDSVNFLSVTGMRDAGRSLSLGLMVLGRETDY